MDRIEIQQTGGFPLESDTLTFMQSAFDSLNKFGYLGGNSIIVQGCVEYAGNVSNGWVFVNGELVPFEGGTVGANVRIVETVEERIFENGESKAVYRRKKAVFGSPGIPWSVFKRPLSTWDLTNNLNQIAQKTVPIGAIMMWAGAVNAIPTGWKLCDGTNGTPDLSGKFIVGYKNNDSDYDAIGKTGGSKSVTLTEGQMPQHTHGASNAGGHIHTYDDSYFFESAAGLGSLPRVPGTLIESFAAGTYVGGGSTDTDNNRMLYRIRNTSSVGNHTHELSEEGNNEAHENRPPYYTLAYIQFKNA